MKVASSFAGEGWIGAVLMPAIRSAPRAASR
jgi:hypothetical protein